MSRHLLKHLFARSPWPRFQAYALLAALLLILAGCSSIENVPAPSTPSTTQGFIFSVDPADGLVTLSEGSSSALAPQGVLTNDVDLGASYTYSFEPGNVLVIEATFTNLLGDMSFAQPFFFTVNEATTNILSSEEPEVTADDLGGDGVLEPGETTSTLTFRVQHKGEPFVYVVDADAQRTVREVGFTQSDVIAFVSRYVTHVGEVGSAVAGDLGVRALLAPLTELEGQLPAAPGAACGADACLPRGVYDYSEGAGDGSGGAWTLAEPSDDLVLRYEVDSSPAVLSIDWNAGGVTLVQTALPGSELSPPDAPLYTYEVPTAPALSLTVDGVSAAQLAATLTWTDACSLSGIGLTRFSLNGSVGLGATAIFNNVGFVENNNVIGFTGSTTLTAGADAATFGGFAELGFTPDESGACALAATSLNRVTLSLNTSVRVGGVNTRLGASLGIENIDFGGDDTGDFTGFSADLSGLLSLNGRAAVNLIGTLDDENGNGVPGENVSLSFADDTTITLEAFIVRFFMAEGLSTLSRLAR